MSPRISVIIPTHNRANLLREALDSVAAQTVGILETIVVDDGSTEPIAAAMAGHPARPRIVRQEQRGPAAARNRGVREASADLIAFLDSDDLWLPNKLERFEQARRSQPEIAVWYGPMAPADETRHPVEGRTKPCHGGIITRALFDSSFVHVPTVLIQRDVFQSFGGFDESLPVCEDYDLWLRMSVKHEFGLIEQPLAIRRLHGNRLSKSCMHRNLAVKIRVLERFYESHRGNGCLDDVAARDRLAHVAFAAGRAALRAGHFRAARDLFAKARQYGAGWGRWAPMLTAATVLSGLDRANGELATARP